MRRLLGMRRVRAVLMAALILSLLLGCGGLNSEQGHKVAVDLGTRFADFNRYLGLLDPGYLAPPWIIKPIDGSTARDSVDIEGMAMSSVRAGFPDAAALVQVYITPGSTRLSEEYLAGVAAIDADGHWVLEDAQDLWKGRNTIYAVATYGDVKSDPGSVVVTSSSGREPPPGTGDGATDDLGRPKRAPSDKQRTVNVSVVAARPKDNPAFTVNPESHARAMAKELIEYFDAASYGAIKIVLKDLVVLESELPQTEKTYAEGKHSYRVDSAAASGLDQASYDVLIAMHSGSTAQHARSLGYKGDPLFLSTSCGVFKKGKPAIVVGEIDSAGTWMHEMGHALGGLIIDSGDSERGYLLPDLYEGPDHYPMGYGGYTNLAERRYFGLVKYLWEPYVLMGAGNHNAGGPPDMTALSKRWLEWLDFRDIQRTPWIGQVPTIETMGYGATIPVYKPEQREDVTYVFEPRSSTHWRDSIPSTESSPRLFVYRLRNSNMDRSKANIFMPPGQPDFVNGVALLRPGYGLGTLGIDSYLDPENEIVVRHESVSIGVHSVDSRVSVAPIGFLKHLLVEPLSGSIMGTSGEYPEGLFDITPADPLMGASVPGDTGAVPLPDLDLHAYLADGSHIGMNYETGEYETPVEGAIVSGDLIGDSEWILLPSEVARGARFTVSNRKTEEFIKAAEQAGVDTSDISAGLAYEITPVSIDPVVGIDKGEPLEGVLPPGSRLSYDIASSEDSSPSVVGASVADTGGTDGPPDRAGALLIPLAIAGGCLLVAVLAWTWMIFRRLRE